MSRTALFLTLLLVGTTVASAQSRVHEKDLTGTWKLVIDLDTDSADGALERIALKAAAGLMDEIDVRFQFQSGHRLKVTANAFDEDEDVEYSEWRINDRGQLILGDNDHFTSDDTVWMFDDGHLIAIDLDGRRPHKKENVRLERMD